LSRFAILVAASLAVAAVISWGVGRTASSTPVSPSTGAAGGLDLVLPPSSVQELVDASALIVTGQFTGVIASTDVVFPSQSVGLPGGISSSVPFSNLEFKVDAYLKGSGPAILLVRQTGDLTKSDGPAEFPKPPRGESTLLFLTPDSHGVNVWTSHRGPYGRLSEKDGATVYGDGDHTVVPFLIGNNLSAAIATVRAATVPVP